MELIIPDLQRNPDNAEAKAAIKGVILDAYLSKKAAGRLIQPK